MSKPRPPDAKCDAHGCLPATHRVQNATIDDETYYVDLCDACYATYRSYREEELKRVRWCDVCHQETVGVRPYRPRHAEPYSKPLYVCPVCQLIDAKADGQPLPSSN